MSGGAAPMALRVLHVLSQRPSQTGSGVTLDAHVRHAAQAGWQQMVVVGTPASDPSPEVGGLEPGRIRPLRFESEDLPFPVPGMSDVMPYPSSRFSALGVADLRVYREAWRRHLREVLAEFRPDLIQTHHVWLVSALLKDEAPEVPVALQCHATGLRQMQLCPHLAAEVREGCARCDRFLTLTRSHAEALAERLGVSAKRTHVVGAGYRDDLFHTRGRVEPSRPELLYVGKLSVAKGVMVLLDALERLAPRVPGLRLHVVGSGEGPETETIRARMARMGPLVVAHGQIAQAELAEVMRRATVCVLPSFYEGVPLVLVEAVASGCRLVATALPGVVEELAPHLAFALDLVPLPRMLGVDAPHPAGLPDLVSALDVALGRAIAGPPVARDPAALARALAPFTWAEVFRRVSEVWRDLLGLG